MFEAVPFQNWFHMTVELYCNKHLNISGNSWCLILCLMPKNPRKAGKIPPVLLAMTLTENTHCMQSTLVQNRSHKHRQKDFAFTQRTVSYIDHLIDVVVFIAIAHAQAEEQHRLRPNCRPWKHIWFYILCHHYWKRKIDEQLSKFLSWVKFPHYSTDCKITCF